MSKKKKADTPFTPEIVDAAKRKNAETMKVCLNRDAKNKCIQPFCDYCSFFNRDYTVPELIRMYAEQSANTRRKHAEDVKKNPDVDDRYPVVNVCNCIDLLVSRLNRAWKNHVAELEKSADKPEAKK